MSWSAGASVGEELALLFAGDLNPVAPKAQKKVPVPEGCVCTCVYMCVVMFTHKSPSGNTEQVENIESFLHVYISLLGTLC